VLLSECLGTCAKQTATDGIIFGNDDKLTFYGTSDASHAIAQEVINRHPRPRFHLLFGDEYNLAQKICLCHKFPLPPRTPGPPGNGRTCLPRGTRVGARQKAAPRIGVQQQVKTKPQLLE
jgi:hypothetical protein